MVLRVSRVTVVGAGLMGHGIVQVAAQVAGFEVWMLDVKQEFVERGMSMIRESLSRFATKGTITGEQMQRVISRIHATTNLEEAVNSSHLIIEAATEDSKLKLDLFRRISQTAQEDAILASNTSSISITLLGSVTKNPTNVVGMHFFNPPQLMPLIEIVRGARTSDETIQSIREVAVAMKKETVLCKKDSPGFIVNRILVPALNEAVALVNEGVADPEDIDKAIRLGLNWPMGPLRLLDYVGLDTTLNIVQVFMDEFQDSKYRPSPLLKQMVRAGQLGRKSGRGFYDWSSSSSK